MSGQTEPGRNRADSARHTDLMKRAGELAEKGLYDEAIDNIKEAMAICPRNPECNIQLANIYRAQRRIGPAVEAMRAAMEIDPLNPNLQEQLLKTLLELERYDEAISTSEKLLKLHPRSVLARNVLGIAYLQRGMLDKALKSTNELIRMSPSDPAHHFKKAVLLQQKGHVSDAMMSFLRSLELDQSGVISDDAREAIAALDGYQLRQILTLAVEDAVFRAKLAIDAESAIIEKGFRLSRGGILTLRQLDISDLPTDPQIRHYH